MYWTIILNIGKINMIKYLNDIEAMNKVSEGFAKRSNRVLKGCIGAIDGGLVKIRTPSTLLYSYPISFLRSEAFFELFLELDGLTFILVLDGALDSALILSSSLSSSS